MNESEQHEMRQAVADLRAQIEVVRNDVGRMVEGFQQMRVEVLPQVRTNAQAIDRLTTIIHGRDGEGGLVVSMAELKQKANAMLWTVRTIGGASFIALVGIFWKLVTTAGH